MKDYFFPGSIVLAVILDRITKFFALSFFSPPLQIIPGIFQLALTINSGAAFSFLKGNNTLLILLSSLVIGVIAYAYKSTPKTHFTNIGFGLIFGGALGNLADRFFYAGIIDFIDVLSFPVFNIADSAITIGVVILGYYFLFVAKK